MKLLERLTPAEARDYHAHAFRTNIERSRVFSLLTFSLCLMLEFSLYLNAGPNFSATFLSSPHSRLFIVYGLVSAATFSLLRRDLPVHLAGIVMAMYLACVMTVSNALAVLDMGSGSGIVAHILATMTVAIIFSSRYWLLLLLFSLNLLELRLIGLYFDVEFGPGVRSDAIATIMLVSITAITLEGQRRREFLSNRALSQANQAKSDFLAHMSHELRTPLNAIIGFSEFMLLKSPEPAKLEEYLKMIRSSGKHLLSVINDILDLSKIEAREMEIDLVPVNLEQEALACHQIFSGTIKEKKQTLANVFEEPDILIDADPRLIRQNLLNLLSNASKFSPDGSVIEIGAHSSEGNAVIWVEDVGIGMEPGEIERAVKPFGQVGNTYQKEFEGTGLGLSIVKSYTELMGGTLEIESEMGEGTRVSMAFPLHENMVRRQRKKGKGLTNPSEAN